MVHYYTQKGFMPSNIFNAPEGEKAFLFASMQIELEKKPGFQCPWIK
jgi:hypothetical protein